MNDTRKGRIKISVDLIEDAPEVIRQIMGKMIIVRAECLYYERKRGVIEYIALSPEFDRVKQGEQIPEYRVIISSKKMGIKNIVDKITFEKEK